MNFGKCWRMPPARRALASRSIPCISALRNSPFPTIGGLGVRSCGCICTQSYGVFPNLVMPLGATGFPILQFWPNGIDKARMEVWWFGPDWGEGPRPAEWDGTISFFNSVLEEDTVFGAWIQKSHQSYGFESVPLSYQEARIYWWNQAADALIGPENIPEELRVAPVIGEAWIYPNDPRLANLARDMAAE